MTHQAADGTTLVHTRAECRTDQSPEGAYLLHHSNLKTHYQIMLPRQGYAVCGSHVICFFLTP